MFKPGDRVRVRAGVSSQTHAEDGPHFIREMDEYLGHTLVVHYVGTVDSYIAVYMTNVPFSWSADWLIRACPRRGVSHA